MRLAREEKWNLVKFFFLGLFGLMLLLLGLYAHDHYSPIVSFCASPLGQVEREMQAHTRAACSNANHQSSFGIGLAVIGGIVFVYTAMSARGVFIRRRKTRVQQYT